MRLKNFLALLALLILASFALSGDHQLARAQSHPCDAPNVIPREVCGFDTFYGSPPRQIPNGWTAYVLSGDLSFQQHVDTFWGAPALMMWSNGGTFKAGIYTQVRVTPGAGYRAAVFWAAPNAPDTFGRQLGIDPTGGTDPNAPTVVWGPMHWGPGRILSHNPPEPGVDIDVKARAQSDVITVFFLTDHNRSTGDNVLFVDAIALYPDESAPALPTPTPVPPTATPVPTFTPTLAATDTPTVTPTATATDTPTPTPSPTPTATPTSTPTATPSPTPTSTPSPTPTPTPTPGFFGRMMPKDDAGQPDPIGLLVDLSGVTGLLMTFGLGYWIYRSD